MAITARGKRFQVAFRVRGVRHRKSFRTWEQAAHYEQQVRAADASLGTPLPKVQGVQLSTLQELRDYTLKLHWRGMRSESTAALASAEIVSLLGPSTPIRDLNSSAVQRLRYVWKQDGLAPGTINRKLSSLSRMLIVAQEAGLIDSRPAVRRERTPEGRTRYLSPEEEAAILAKLEALGFPDIAALCLFLVETGLRVGEALKLSWTDCGGGRVAVRGTKGDQPRLVPLTEAAERALSSRAGQPKPFASIKPERLAYAWNKAKVSLGMGDDKELVPHALRHTCASRLVQGGVDIVTVKNWLGHKTVQMTMRYAHVSPRQMEEARGVLSRIRDSGKIP